MPKLFLKLFSLLFAGVDGEPDDDIPSDNTDALDPVDDIIDDGDESDDVVDPPVSTRPRRDDSDDRLAKLEAEFEKRSRIAEETQAAKPSQYVDPEFQREEERLRSADITDLERWQIQSNRTLRTTLAESRQAVAQAHDLADRTRFEAKASSDPRRAKYTERVEQEVQKARSRGQHANREDVYYWMLGKDIADGKLKSKPKASPAASVPRGKSPSVKSDIQSRGRVSSDRDKLRSRLENVNI